MLHSALEAKCISNWESESSQTLRVKSVLQVKGLQWISLLLLTQALRYCGTMAENWSINQNIFHFTSS